MPDFMSKIAAMKERTAEIKKQEETDKVKQGDEQTIQSQFDSMFSGGGNGAKPKQEQEPTLNFNPDSLGDIVSGVSVENTARRR